MTEKKVIYKNKKSLKNSLKSIRFETAILQKAKKLNIDIQETCRQAILNAVNEASKN